MHCEVFNYTVLGQIQSISQTFNNKKDKRIANFMRCKLCQTSFDDLGHKNNMAYQPDKAQIKWVDTQYNKMLRIDQLGGVKWS